MGGSSQGLGEMGGERERREGGLHAGRYIKASVPLRLAPSLSLSLPLCFSQLRSSLNFGTMASSIEQAMALLIAAFHKFSGKEGDALTLSKGELKELLQSELGALLGKAADKAAVDKIFADLDANQDGTVDFQEYVTLIACLTMLCNEFFVKK